MNRFNPSLVVSIFLLICLLYKQPAAQQVGIHSSRQTAITHAIEKISNLISKSEFFFEGNFDEFQKINIKDLKDFKKIMIKSHRASKWGCMKKFFFHWYIVYVYLTFERFGF